VWLVLRPGCFTHGETLSGVHWIEDWMDSRVGLDAVHTSNFSEMFQRSDKKIVY
jgi:hypothetical protein